MEGVEELEGESVLDTIVVLNGWKGGKDVPSKAGCTPMDSGPYSTYRKPRIHIKNLVKPSRTPTVRSLFLRNGFWQISMQRDVVASWGFHHWP